ncbi:SIR2 family protein [Lentibacillus salicampi]|uniref:SIR2 family protein n=1 Tax=Lentibacillus salicampi TaxID=175306 RepID=A0A4Y9A662_9BACI|nr:SIR2 family protein [Lentibacillus salicampi]
MDGFDLGRLKEGKKGAFRRYLNYVEGELYKIHGCITDPDNIVIASSDYSNFRSNAKLFSAKLLTLISKNPVIFIGYSISESE